MYDFSKSVSKHQFFEAKQMDVSKSTVVKSSDLADVKTQQGNFSKVFICIAPPHKF
jgi:hypothetical protein